MTPSPLIDDRTRTNRSRRRSTGNARARAKPLSLSALTPPAREAYGGHDNRGEQEAATRHKMHHIRSSSHLDPPAFGRKPRIPRRARLAFTRLMMR